MEENRSISHINWAEVLAILILIVLVMANSPSPAWGASAIVSLGTVYGITRLRTIQSDIVARGLAKAQETTSDRAVLAGLYFSVVIVLIMIALLLHGLKMELYR